MESYPDWVGHGNVGSAKAPTETTRQVRLVRLGVEDLRAAVGAEVKDVLLAVGLVARAARSRCSGRTRDLIALEAGLHAKGAARPPLAGEAVADRDGERLADDRETELAAVAGGPAHQRPTNLGSRFSTNAVRPSLGAAGWQRARRSRSPRG